MKFAFCIGNGESRRNFDLHKLQKYGKIYGSNALFRDLNVDVLVCCDRRMAMETVSKGYKGTVYTRKDWYSFFPYENFKKLPDLPWPEKEKWTQSFHMGSGLHAVNIALLEENDIIVLCGHDFWGIENKHNNLYKDSENYESKEHNAIDPSFWIKQFEMFFNLYEKKNFVFAHADGWRCPEGWNKKENVSFQELNTLVDTLKKLQ